MDIALSETKLADPATRPIQNFHHYPYRLLNESYIWVDARQACEDEGAKLAMPKTTDDLDDIISYNSKLP